MRYSEIKYSPVARISSLPCRLPLTLKGRVVTAARCFSEKAVPRSNRVVESPQSEDRYVLPRPQSARHSFAQYKSPHKLAVGLQSHRISPKLLMIATYLDLAGSRLGVESKPGSLTLRGGRLLFSCSGPEQVSRVAKVRQNTFVCQYGKRNRI